MKRPFVTEAQMEKIVRQFPTPFHLYDETGIRETARRLKAAFAWNPGFKEYFAVKANPNPAILKILREEGCGADCSSLTELMLADKCGFTGSEIMFSSNDTPAEEFQLAAKLGATITVFTVVDGEEFVLQDEFETLTEDVRIERIEPGETVSHEWVFDGTLEAARHGREEADGTYRRKAAPKGVYSIRVSTGEVIENAFELK